MSTPLRVNRELVTLGGNLEGAAGCISAPAPGKFTFTYNTGLFSLFTFRAGGFLSPPPAPPSGFMRLRNITEKGRMVA